MKRDLVSKCESSFLSCEKDIEIILNKLFQSKPHSDILKKLLIINNSDCLDADSEVYRKKIDVTPRQMVKDGYIKFNTKNKLYEHDEVKSYLMITMDNFIPNATNPEFRDYNVIFDIICHTEYWDLGNYRQRPLKIAGYIDGLLNKTKLTGIGTFNFLGCSNVVFDDNFSGYILMYRAIHGSDDRIEPDE